MAVIRIILGALAGTTVMTLFSYYLSYKLGRQFKEPVILNKLYRRLVVRGTALKAIPVIGWIFHYFIGTVFMVLYHFIWRLTAVEPSLLSGSVLGFFSGFIGIAGWSLMFNLHPDPPSVNFRKYYLQLISAHVIFGIGAVIGYTLF